MVEYVEDRGGGIRLLSPDWHSYNAFFVFLRLWKYIRNNKNKVLFDYDPMKELRSFFLYKLIYFLLQKLLFFKTMPISHVDYFVECWLVPGPCQT